MADLKDDTTPTAGGNQVDTLSVDARVQLMLAQVEIYKLKANDHDWQVYVPDSVKDKLNVALEEIDKLTAVTDLPTTDPDTNSKPSKAQ